VVTQRLQGFLPLGVSHTDLGIAHTPIVRW
jgi:hypothetical protein